MLFLYAAPDAPEDEVMQQRKHGAKDCSMFKVQSSRFKVRLSAPERRRRGLYALCYKDNGALRQTLQRTK
jgi:hypothetical protein